MNENRTTSKYIEWDLEKFKSGWPAEWHAAGYLYDYRQSSDN